MDRRTTLTEVYRKIHTVEQQLLKMRSGLLVADKATYAALEAEHRLLRLWAAQIKRG